MSRRGSSREQNSRIQTKGPYRAPLAFLGAVVLVVVVAGLPWEPGAALASSHPMEQQLIELINQARLDNGDLPPLKLNSALAVAADGHSDAMGQRNFTGHCDPDTGSMPVDRTSAAGYGASWVGENIGWGFPSAQDAFNWWMNSTPHRSNILNTQYREAGAGYAFDAADTANVRYDPDTDCAIEYWNRGPYYRYYTLTFGRDSQVYPVVIEREAASTESRSVSLYIYGSGWADEMRLSNDGVTWTEWEPFSPARTWTLSPGNGIKTVHTEIRDAGTGSVRSASDTIDLQESAPLPDTPTSTSTSTYSPTAIPSPSTTPSPTATDSPSPTAAPRQTDSPTATVEAVQSPTATPPDAARTATATVTPSASATPTDSPTPSTSPTATPPPLPTGTASPTASSTPSRTPTPTLTRSSTATATSPPSPTPTATPTPTWSPTPTATATPSPPAVAGASGSSLAPPTDDPDAETRTKPRRQPPAKAGAETRAKAERHGMEKPRGHERSKPQRPAKISGWEAPDGSG